MTGEILESLFVLFRAVNTREGLAITNVNKDVYVNNNSQTLRFLVNYSLLRLEFFSLS